MRRARNVEDQPVGGVERDERRVARAALRQPVEPGGIGDGIVRHDGKVADLCAGIGERHAGGEPQRRGVRIDARETERPALLFGKDDRGVRRRRGAAQPFGREPREEERQIAPPPGRLAHRDSIPSASGRPRGRRASVSGRG